MTGTLIVIFEDIPPEQVTEPGARGAECSESDDHPRVRQLEQELRSNKEYLQTTIEELETANEELKSTNEELQSSNEELQSTNEELETSKEELQSVNEELTTVNAEHQQKIEELSKTTSDLNNLLASTEVGTIFLDKNLHIQRFTPSVTDFINLIHTDIGRPVSHIVSNIEYDGLVDDAKEVLRRLVPREVEVKTKDHRWYQMRVIPYRTTENVIDGVVVTFAEITRLKKALDELEGARNREAIEEARNREAIEEACKREFWETVADTAHEAVLILDKDLHIEEANQAFFKLFNTTRDETRGISFFEIGDGYCDIPALRDLLEKLLPEKTVIQDYRVEGSCRNLGKRIMLLNAKRLETSSLFPDRIVLAIQDITELGRLLKGKDAGGTPE
jgi:two-component system CheB/CheR fusion protein